MSTASATNITLTSSVSPTSSSQPEKGKNHGSTLYLLAFLATLLLLIIVSAGVVVRAYLVRRVLQRRLHEALAPAGYEHPDPGGPSARARRKKIKYGEKPRLWEASVTLDGFAEASHASTWMPVSVRLPHGPMATPSLGSEARDVAVLSIDGFPKLSYRRPPAHDGLSQQPRLSSPPPFSTQRRPQLFRRRSTSIADKAVTLNEKPLPIHNAHEVQVSLLIAMPSLHQSSLYGLSTRRPELGREIEGEPHPGEVEIGITDVYMRR